MSIFREELVHEFEKANNWRPKFVHFETRIEHLQNKIEEVEKIKNNPLVQIQKLQYQQDRIETKLQNVFYEIEKANFHKQSHGYRHNKHNKSKDDSLDTEESDPDDKINQKLDRALKKIQTLENQNLKQEDLNEQINKSLK